MKPIKSRVQNYPTQTGVGDDLLFTWKYESGHHTQTAYRVDILNKGNIVASTGRVDSSEQYGIGIELACPLDEQSFYTYVITVWDENGLAEASEPAEFITGVRNWSGHWIGHGTPKPFIARKFFRIDDAGAFTGDARAVLSLVGVGQFDARINGVPVSPYAYEGSQTNFHTAVLWHGSRGKSQRGGKGPNRAV